MAEIAVSASLVLAEVALLFLKDLYHEHIRDKIQGLQMSLRGMLAYLKDMENRNTSHMLEDKARNIRNVAHDIEDILDEYMLYAQYQLHPYKIARAAYKVKQYWIQHRHINSMIDDVQKKINQIKGLDTFLHVSADAVDQGSTSSGSRARQEMMRDHLEDEEIVGFKVPLGELSHHLVHDGEPRQVTISVVGSGGSGKTVLVNNVYKSIEVRRQFDCRAWVHVTRTVDVEKLLDNVLRQFCSSREEQIPRSQQGGDIGEKLWNYLQTKKYLVVFDGIWSEEQWGCIKIAFPKNSCGSRMIVTTRNSSVANFCTESDKSVLKLTKLSSPDAWDLFCKKAFRKSNGGKCHPTVKDYAENILKKCEGLPIAIVAIAGMLSQKQLLPREWQKLSDSLGSKIRGNSILSNILVPSYEDLTPELKKCLLYFSNFPEDHKIGTRRLIRLWVAERFVEDNSGATTEEVAEEYLNELIERNLIHVVQSDYDGQVKRCRVPKLVLEFILQKVEEENFVSVLPGKIDIFTDKVRRLSVHDDSLTELESILDLSRVRSLFLFNSKPSTGDVKIFSKFKLLRVLDMQGAAVDEFPRGIFLLTLLRYLSLRNTGVKNVPNKIKKLTFLETLDLRGTKVTELPAKIVRLAYLRHLFVYSYNVRFSVAFDSVTGVQVSDGIVALTNLQKLSVVKVDECGQIIKALEKLTQLRKLGLINLKWEDGANLCTSIRKMRHLATLDVSSISKDEKLDLEMKSEYPRHLQHLHLKGRLQNVPSWIPELHNLFKISLMWSRLEYNPLQCLQDLPNLMELQMVDAYCLPKLQFEAGKFKKLKILYIGQFDELDEVIIGKGAVPELRKLSLSTCKKMKTLPFGIHNLEFVENLHFYQMPDEFIAHLKSSEGKEMVSHIPVVLSYTVSEPVTDNSYWVRENLS